MQISLPKTEITLFSQNNIENQEPVVTIDNHVFQYNEKPKLLGVYFDENSIPRNILKLFLIKPVDV